MLESQGIPDVAPVTQNASQWVSSRNRTLDVHVNPR